MPRSRRIIAVFIAIALAIAASCSSSDDTETAADDDTAESDTSTPESTEVQPEDDVAPEEADPPVEDPAVELTASYQGVTESEIRLGVAATDYQAIKDLGFDLGFVPVAELYESWAAAQNERGGINGRDVVVEVGYHLPLGSDTASTLCTQLTEDFAAFAIIGQFTEDNALCVSELHGLPYIGLFGLTQERLERSDGRFVSMELSLETQATAGTQAMIDAGDFDGKRLAVFWANDADKGLADSAIEVLEANNIEIIEKAGLPSIGADTVAIASAADNIMQRFIASDIDIILAFSIIVTPIDAADRNGLDVEIAFTNGQIADGIVIDQSTASEDAKARTFAVTTNKPTYEEATADPGVIQCVEEFEAMFPDLEMDLTEPQNAFAMVNHCRAFRLAVVTLEAAGPNPTPESFVDGVAEIGTFELPAMNDPELTATKHDAGSEVHRYEYDRDLRKHVKVGEPISTR